jgi:hypothetical protein
MASNNPVPMLDQTVTVQTMYRGGELLAEDRLAADQNKGKSDRSLTLGYGDPLDLLIHWSVLANVSTLPQLDARCKEIDHA